MVALRQRQPPVRSPEHLTWVRSHHCCVDGCNRRPIEAHHVRTGGAGGMGMKPSDHMATPLCRTHHTEHNLMGWQSFEAKYGLDLRQIASKLAGQSPYLS